METKKKLTIGLLLAVAGICFISFGVLHRLRYIVLAGWLITAGAMVIFGTIVYIRLKERTQGL